MSSHNKNFDDVERFQAKIEAKTDTLFRARPDVAPLYISRSVMKSSDRHSETATYIQDEKLESLSSIEDLKKCQNDSSQIFHVRQRSSWTTLDTSREMFEKLMTTYNILPHFWKCVLTFGIKSEENEFEFPPFRARNRSGAAEITKTFESSYMLRRVEPSGRKPSTDRNGWSIRQTAVYHQLRTTPDDSPFARSEVQIGDGVQIGPGVYIGGNSTFGTTNKSMFLVIAMSKNVVKHIDHCVEQFQASPWNIQRLLVADSLRNWSDYMACLNAELSRISKRIVSADVGPKTENLPALTDIFITFEDRQELAELQDAIHDLQIIMPATLQTVKRIRDQCVHSYDTEAMSKAERLSFEMAMNEFEEYIIEAELHVQRAEALGQHRAKSTTKLMSDLLSYEEAVAIKELAKESHKEGKSMHKLTVSSHHLTKRSTQDAAAMKILTIITLIYLPTTIVANFFSTQFVQKDAAGNMQVAKNVWLLAVISIPLTLFTILLWWGWVAYTKVPSAQSTEEHMLSVEHQSFPRILRRGSTFRNLIPSSRKKKTPTDEESGTLSSPLSPPSPSSTFRSDATTTKEG